MFFIDQYPLLFISYKYLPIIESIKSNLDILADDILSNHYNGNITLEYNLKKQLKTISLEGIGCSSISGLPFRFIGYALNEVEEKIYYKCYSFSKNNHWSNIVSNGISIDLNYTESPIIELTEKTKTFNLYTQ